MSLGHCTAVTFTSIASATASVSCVNSKLQHDCEQVVVHAISIGNKQYACREVYDRRYKQAAIAYDTLSQ
jgi:hypothetical protein